MSILMVGSLVIGTIVTMSALVAMEDKEKKKREKEYDENTLLFIRGEKHSVNEKVGDAYKITTYGTDVYMMVLEKNSNELISVQKGTEMIFQYQKINGNVHITSKKITEETKEKLKAYIDNQEWKNKIEMKEIKIKENAFVVPYMDTYNEKLKEDLMYLEEVTNKLLKEKLSIRDKHRIESKNETLAEIIKKFNRLGKEEKAEFENRVEEIINEHLKELIEIKKEKEKETKKSLKDDIDFFKKL